MQIFLMYKNIKREIRLFVNKLNNSTTTNRTSFLDPMHWWGECYTPRRWMHPGQLPGSRFWIADAKKQKKSRTEGWQPAASPSLRTISVFSPFANSRAESKSENSLAVTSVSLQHITQALFILRSTSVVISGSSRARDLWSTLKHPARSHFHDSHTGSSSQC